MKKKQPENSPVSEEAGGAKLPDRVFLLSNFSAYFPMPGRTSIGITKSFKAGTIVENADDIALLYEHGVNLEAL